MKARKFLKRERRKPGRATGTILCRLLLPALEQRYDFYITPGSPTRAIETIRKLVNRHLTKDSKLLTDSSFVIEAEIRAANGGMRRKEIATWKFGENLASAYEAASRAWETLDLEEEYSAFEVEI